MTARTRLLGVDFGTVRVGLAISDPDRSISSPFLTLYRKNKEMDAATIRRIVEEEAVGGILVGLPIHTNGTVGVKAHEAQEYGKWLGEITGLPVFFWDERFTSIEAEGYLLMGKLTNKKRKERRDQLAAQILLQSFLEAGCPDDFQPRALDG